MCRRQDESGANTEMTLRHTNRFTQKLSIYFMRWLCTCSFKRKNRYGIKIPSPLWTPAEKKRHVTFHCTAPAHPCRRCADLIFLLHKNVLIRNFQFFSSRSSSSFSPSSASVFNSTLDMDMMRLHVIGAVMVMRQNVVGTLYSISAMIHS